MTTTTERAPAPPGLLYAMADQRRSQLDARDAQAQAELRRHLGAAAERTEAELAKVTQLIASTAPELRSPAWLYQQARYKDLLATIEQSYAAAGPGGVAAITDAQRWAQQQGQADAKGLGSQAAGLRAGDFLGVNPANLTTSVGFLADGSPVAQLFASYGAQAATAAAQTLSTGVLLGWGSDKLAREFRRTVTGMVATRSETLARTELHRVYRATSRDVYHANADVLTGWVWLAKLDTRTCSSCIAMSGTIHSVGDTLDGHPRCRCAMVPITNPWEAIDPRLGELKNTTAQVPTGADWLRAQPPATKRAVMGPTKYALYQRGQIDVQDLVTQVHDPDWGTMRREATVTEARANAAARGVRQTFPRKRNAVTQQQRKAVQTKARQVKAEPPAIPKPPAPPTKTELRRQLKEANAEVERRVLAMKGPDDVPALLAAHEARNRLQEQLDAAGHISSLGELPKLPPAMAARPGVVQANTNPDYGLPGYDVNCVHVVQTYEMRRRGFDVEATSLPVALRPKNGRQLSDSLARNWTHADGRPVTEADVIFTRNITALKDGVKSWGHGGRGIVRISWKGGGGHVYSVENVNGQPLFRELQSTGNDTSADYWKRAKSASGGRSHLWLVRMDDKLPTDGLLHATDPTIRPAGD